MSYYVTLTVGILAKYLYHMEKARPKLLVYYDAIINQNTLEKVNFNQFFLLKCRSECLEEKLGQLTKSEHFDRKSVYRTVISNCVTTINDHENIQFVNACQTFTAFMGGLAKKNGMGFDVEKILFESTHASFGILMKRFNYVLNIETNIVLKECIYYTILKILTCVPDVNSNSLVPFLFNPEFFESLFLTMTHMEMKALLGRTAFRILCVLNCRVENPHPFLTKMANFDQSNYLQAYIEIIRNSLMKSNAKFIEEHCKEVAESSLIESLSNKISSIFSNEHELEEVKVDLVELEILLGLFDALRTNPTFTSLIVSTRSSNFSTQTSTLSEFLIYCSFCLHNYKTDAARLRAKLCLLILIRLSDHSFIQNIMLDELHVEEVPIYKPQMLHRPAYMDLRPPPTTIANSILALMTEFITSNLKQSCHMEHFDLSLGVIHRILSCAQEMEKRIDVWRPLFNALISLLRFLVSNEKKIVNAHPVMFRIMVVLNLFLTSGDAFLPSLESYESLFYEIIRQQTAFEGLRKMVDTKCESDQHQDVFRDRISLRLSNVETIFRTIFPKLEQFTNNIEEHQILQIIRDSFADLHLKIFDGQKLVDKYDTSLHQNAFFSFLCLKVVGRAHELTEQNAPEYKHYLDALSCEKPSDDPM